MVKLPAHLVRFAREVVFSRAFSIVRAASLAGIILFATACATSDHARIGEARDHYLKDDFKGAEAALFTPEVFKNSQNRLEHFYMLSSIAMSEGLYEKAIYYLNRSRDIANQVRSSSGTFEWFSTDYRSNPVEYSYIHSMLVMSYLLLAESGQSPAWATPELKDEKGNPLVPAQNFAARKLDAREAADFRQKARSELLAWDTFLENLKKIYPTEKLYKEDLWARMLASYVHSGSSDNAEKRTAELLLDDAKKVLEKENSRYPSTQTNVAEIEKLLANLRKRALSKNDQSSMFVLEAGVVGKYKIRRFQIGVSTLFKSIQDPQLRNMMEQIGMQVLLTYAPEFGLIALGGAVAGAIDGANPDDDEFDGPPRFFTDAIDRSFGFQIQFPTMVYPASDTKVRLSLLQPGKTAMEFPLPVVSPLQEIIAAEMRGREQKEVFAKAVSIGAQYLTILVPAIIAYRNADRDGNVFKKLAILAGYYIAKKAIDRAHQADLRSWNTLPALIAANMIEVPAGTYETKVLFDNQFGHEERALGPILFGNLTQSLIRARVGDLPMLRRRDPRSVLPIQ